MSSHEFNPGAIIKAFNEHRVQYVVIGAFAAIAQHAPIGATTDIDFVPSKSPENLERLSTALRDLDARIRVASEVDGFAFDPTSDFLEGMKMLNLVCQFGDFDLVFEPAGFSGYDDLKGSALTERGGIERSECCESGRCH